MKKKWYESKTVWGILIALLGIVFQYDKAFAVGLAWSAYGFRDAMK